MVIFRLVFDVGRLDKTGAMVGPRRAAILCQGSRSHDKPLMCTTLVPSSALVCDGTIWKGSSMCDQRLQNDRVCHPVMYHRPQTSAVMGHFGNVRCL
mmetsp:Transcript_22579/g.52102  ORF Transcript_22579/g.52102 Transcript_22579/m.52102 type:complete len:97 (-) Transcript_22579:284-574(-)